MPSDDEKSSSDKGIEEKQSMLVKAGAALFATVIAPVLIATGMKFSDALVALVTPKPEASKEASKDDPGKTESTKTDSGHADSGKPDSGKPDSGKPDSGKPDAPRVKKNKKFAVAAGDQAKPNSTAGFRTLFNGRDLAGWATVDSSRWSADSKNDALVGQDKSGDRKNLRSWLYTDQDFSDFRLRFEYRMEPKTDSGIALRTQPGSAKAKGEDDRIEIQLTSDLAESFPTGTILGLRVDAGHPHTKPKITPSQKPAGEWNLVEIEFRGPRLQVTINGQVIQDVQLPDQPGGKSGKKVFSPSGRIALQSRMGRVEFRNIEIQELTSAGGK